MSHYLVITEKELNITLSFVKFVYLDIIFYLIGVLNFLLVPVEEVKLLCVFYIPNFINIYYIFDQRRF